MPTLLLTECYLFSQEPKLLDLLSCLPIYENNKTGGKENEKNLFDSIDFCIGEQPFL